MIHEEEYDEEDVMPEKESWRYSPPNHEKTAVPHAKSDLDPQIIDFSENADNTADDSKSVTIGYWDTYNYRDSSPSNGVWVTSPNDSNEWKEMYVAGADSAGKIRQSETILDTLPGQPILTTTPDEVMSLDDIEELAEVTVTVKFMCAPDEIGDRISNFKDALNEIPYEELIKFKIKVD